MRSECEQNLRYSKCLRKLNNLTVKEIQLKIEQEGKKLKNDCLNIINQKQYQVTSSTKQLPKLPINKTHFYQKYIHQTNQIEKSIQQSIRLSQKKNFKNKLITNKLLEIIKDNSCSSDYPKSNISKNIRVHTQHLYPVNQFFDVGDSKTTKNKCKPKPKILDNQITRLANQNNLIRRKIYSEENSRCFINSKQIQPLLKQSNQSTQLLTFYNISFKSPNKSHGKQCKIKYHK